MHKVKDLILYWDHTAWLYINNECHTAMLDTVMPFFRNQWFWTPLYLFLLIFMTSSFGKRGWIWCAGFLLSFALSDQLSAHFIKPLVHRLRPCNSPDLQAIIHTLVPCGGGYSFPSSHAANHFSIGIFSAVTLYKKIWWVWIAAILWAGLVAFSQVYVGVHYPLDVICGAMLGTVVGICTGKIYNRYFNLAAT